MIGSSSPATASSPASSGATSYNSFPVNAHTKIIIQRWNEYSESESYYILKYSNHEYYRLTTWNLLSIFPPYMSQTLYAGQSDREDVTFFSDF